MNSRDFHAIGADVLDRAGADGARDQRQVFQAGTAARQASTCTRSCQSTPASARTSALSAVRPRRSVHWLAVRHSTTPGESPANSRLLPSPSTSTGPSPLGVGDSSQRRRRQLRPAARRHRPHGGGVARPRAGCCGRPMKRVRLSLAAACSGYAFLAPAHARRRIRRSASGRDRSSRCRTAPAVAPAAILVAASAPEMMPPTPIIGIDVVAGACAACAGPWWMRPSAVCPTGRRLRRPAGAHPASLRSIVVLVAITPSMRDGVEHARHAVDLARRSGPARSSPASARGGRARCPGLPGPRAVRRRSGAASPLPAGRAGPAVLGEEMLTVM